MDERNLNVVRVKLIDDTPLFGNELIHYSFRANDLLHPDEEKRKRKQKKQSPKHKEQEAR